MNSVRKIGTQKDYSGDLYHLILRARWFRFSSILILLYSATTVFFALLYSFLPVLHLSFDNSNFVDCFAFSLQTLSTIGYGQLYPISGVAHFLVFLEVAAGLAFFAILTGVIFSKFARPKTRFLFSKNILFTKFKGKDALILRIGNERANMIGRAKASLSILIPEKTQEGQTINLFHDLELMRGQTPAFVMSWTLIHYLEEGVLKNYSAKELQESTFRFFVTIEGLDQTYHQVIQSTEIYQSSSILSNRVFKDILSFDKEGAQVIDYRKFHETSPLKKRQ